MGVFSEWFALERGVVFLSIFLLPDGLIHNSSERVVQELRVYFLFSILDQKYCKVRSFHSFESLEHEVYIFEQGFESPFELRIGLVANTYSNREEEFAIWRLDVALEVGLVLPDRPRLPVEVVGEIFYFLCERVHSDLYLFILFIPKRMNPLLSFILFLVFPILTLSETLSLTETADPTKDPNYFSGKVHG